MCTKAISVNVRAMADKLKVPMLSPKSYKPSANKPEGGDTLPTDYAAIITLNRPREIQFMRWGLVPHFATDAKQAGTMFNARAETLLQLPSYRDLVMTSRCLILNEGFYERKTLGDDKVEWLVSPTQDDYFYKAGLWTTWKNHASNELIESFTMITCDPANTPFSKVHDRMPIIMNKEERRLWMNPDAPKEQVMGLLHPCSDEMYRITEYSRKAIKQRRNSDRSDKGLGLF